LDEPHGLEFRNGAPCDRDHGSGEHADAREPRPSVVDVERLSEEASLAAIEHWQAIETASDVTPAFDALIKT
jgi:hypothetical protein